MRRRFDQFIDGAMLIVFVLGAMVSFWEYLVAPNWVNGILLCMSLALLYFFGIRRQETHDWLDRTIQNLIDKRTNNNNRRRMK